MFPKDIQSTVFKSSEHLKNIDAVNTVILLDSHADNAVVQLMFAKELAATKHKIFWRVCFYIIFFYLILIFFSVIFVFICIRLDSSKLK